jgi:hypothetical protein
MRYFLISFSGIKIDGEITIQADGNLTLQLETYPNYQGILATLNGKDQDLENITILNIIELSEQDFKDFTE